LKRVAYLFLAVAALIMIAGCNKAPVINSFAPTHLEQEIYTQDPISFSVNASDPDKNTTLTYSWAFTAGTPLKATTSSVLWTAPASAGTAKAVVTVSDGKKSVTKTWEITVKARPQNAPQNLTSTGAKGKITLTWDASTGDGLTAYYVYRGTEADNLSKIATVNVPTTTYEDTAVEDGVLYYYEVTAYSGAESAPSNRVSTMHGTRITDTAVAFTTNTTDSPYVIEGIVSFGDKLDIASNTKLFVLPGAQVSFTKATAGRIYVSRGLFVSKGTPSYPVYFSSTAGGYELRIVGAAEGSHCDYTEFKDINGTDSLLSFMISACSPTFSNCRFISHSSRATMAQLSNSGASIVNSYFDRISLGFDQTVLPSLSIESNIFLNHTSALSFVNFTSTNPDDYLKTEMLSNNIFECNGTSSSNHTTADLSISGTTTTTAQFPLTGNYFFRSDNYDTPITIKAGFYVYISPNNPNLSFYFGGLLSTRPGTAGPGWGGTLPF